MRDRITREQRIVCEILEAIEAIVGSSASPDFRAIGRERRRLAQALLSHLNWADSQVYPALLARCAASDRVRIEQLQAAARIHADLYREHLADWNADNLLSDWEGYRQASLMRIARIKAHFADRARIIPPRSPDKPLSDAA